MKKLSLLLVCLFSLNAQSLFAGHTARAATGSGTGGTGIETINGIGPTNTHNFTIESADDSVIITALPHGIDLSVPGGASGVSSIVADSSGFAAGNVVISGGSTGLTTDATSSTEIDLTGVLNLSHGGTNANLTASNGGIFYSNSTSGAILPGTSIANQVLISGSSAAPSWSTATYPATTTVNNLLYSSASNTIGQITTTNDGVLITDNTGVPSWLANGITGQVLKATAGSPPSWATITTDEGVSEFVVDSQGNAGYTTIQAAITAAALVATSTTPQTVWIWPGTYTETLTLSDYVHLAAANATGVFVVGNVTYTPAATNAFVSMKGIVITTPGGGGAAFTLAGSALCHVFFNNCTFNGTTGTAFVSTNTNGSTEVFHQNCLFSASSGRQIFAFSGGSGIYVNCFGCSIISANTASTIANNTYLYFLGSYVNDSYVVSSANAILWVEGCQCKGAGNLPFVNCSVQFANAVIFDSTVTCHNTYWATGLGTLFYGNVTSFGNALDGTGSTGSAIDPTIGSALGFPSQVTSISFDGNATTALNTVTQCTANQVVLGTGESALNVVSGTGTTGQLLTSNGTGVDPTWQDNPGVLTVNTLSPNGSGNFSVVAGNNISITSGTNSITINSSGLGDTTEGVSQFVVDSGGTQGYTTIQSAITAAAGVATSTNPQTVWIWPATYAEDLTMVSYVNLSAAASGSVIVTGNATYSPSANNETVFVNNLVFNTPATGDAFSMGGTGDSNIYFNGCMFNATNGSGAGISGTNPNGKINQYHCLMDASSGSQNYNTSMTLNAYSTNTTGGAGSSFSGSGVFATFFYCTFFETLNVSSNLIMDDCVMISHNVVLSGGTLYARNCLFDTGSTYWATGTGNVFYGAVVTGIPLDPALTANPSKFQTGQVSFDGGSTFFYPVTQGTNHQVLLGTGTSAVSTVSGTGTSGQVLTSNGTGAAPTWQYPAITPVSTNYNVQFTDYFIKCTAGGITITLPSVSVPTGQSFVIKDSGGNAFASPITITAGGGILIDGAASYPLDQNYQSAGVLYDGAAYEIFSGYAGQ